MILYSNVIIFRYWDRRIFKDTHVAKSLNHNPILSDLNGLLP